MNSFELKLWDDEGAKCTFYSVLQNGHSETETDKFFSRVDNPSHSFQEELQMLVQLLIDSIGNKYGAIDDFFTRNENLVFALPPRSRSKIFEVSLLGLNFPWRLYCYRISESIVVLFNGGLKESQRVQESPDLHFKFQEAQVFASKIEEALSEGMIVVAADGRTLTDYQGNPEIIC